MKDEYKYYLNTFIIVAIGYGLLTIFLEYIFDGDLTPEKILIKSLIFAVLFTGIAIILGKKNLKKSGGKSYISMHSEEVETNLDKNSLFALIKDNLSSKKYKFNEADNCLSIKTNVNWLSWGENICVKYLNESNKIEITSKSKFPLANIDWGENFKNVQKIKDILSLS